MVWKPKKVIKKSTWHLAAVTKGPQKLKTGVRKTSGAIRTVVRGVHKASLPLTKRIAQAIVLLLIAVVGLLKWLRHTWPARQISIRYHRYLKHHVNKVHAAAERRSRHYRAWRAWEHRNLVHAAFAILFVSVFAFTQLRASALDVSFTWNFTTPSDYTYDGSKFMSEDSKMKLALLDKIENFTLAGGKLQSNNVIDVAADNEYYYISNDLGLDVIRQDTWERSGYISHGGGWKTLVIINGYLYAGKKWRYLALAN